KDIQERMVEAHHDPTVHLPSYQPTVEPNGLQVKKILHQLTLSKKPVLLAGGGINYADANQELIAFAERYQIPVVSTLLGLGA
ncbi:acetolactate synthase large subunit, partial [Streptococcus pyogenes]